MSDYNDGLVPEPCLRLDYGFGQQYASVELGDGTGYVRVTDDLRSEHHKMKRWYDDELRAALDENAKLRKLALDVYVLHWSGLDCTECPWIGECDTDGGCPWLGIMHDHMRDLGIEVPR